MATKLFIRQTTANKTGVAGRFDLCVPAGAAAVEATVNTVASGTEIQWTATAGGQVLEWISPPLAAGFTLATTDTMTFNIWARESNMSANIGGRARVFKLPVAGGALAELPGGPYDDGIEFGTADAAMNWTGVVSANQTFVEGDRIVVRYYITNVGVMAAGFTGILSYDGPTAAADGDSWFQLNNNVTFQTEAVPGVFLKHGPKPSSGFGTIAGHPLAPRHAWLFDERNNATSAKVFDRVGSRHGTLTNSEGTSIRPVGGGLRLRRGTDLIGFGDSRLIIPTTGGCTVVVALRRESTGLTDTKWFQILTFTDAERCEINVVSATSIAWRVGGNAEGTSKLTVSGLTLTGDSLWVATTGPRGMELWQNGLKQGSNAGNPTLTASANNFAVGGDTDKPGDAFQIGVLYVYRRQLTPAECKTISAHPLSPFQFKRAKAAVKYTAPLPGTPNRYLMTLGVGA